MNGRRHFLWSTAVAVVAATAAGCSGDSDDSPTQPTTPPPTGPATLQMIDLTVGTGDDTATTGKTVVINYILYRFDPNGPDSKGEQLESSYQRGQTFPFRMYNAQDSIAGMSQGVEGMKTGGKRRVIIPPSLAYGTTGARDSFGQLVIRPNEWIVFEIELMAIA